MMKFLSFFVIVVWSSVNLSESRCIHHESTSRYENCTDGRPNPAGYCSVLENHTKNHIRKDIQVILDNMNSYVSHNVV